MPFEQAFTAGLRLQDNADLEFGTGNDVSLSSDGTNVNAVGGGLWIWPDDIIIVADEADLTARMRFDAGAVTGGQTRVLSMDDANVNLATIPGNQVIADPGNGGAISVTRSGSCAMTTAGAGETRTLAIPTAVGQRVELVHSVDGGDVTVTAASAINQAGNTKMAFAEVADFIELVGIDIGGVLRWQVVSNDGVALS